jgi:hypothetical protein
LAQTIKRLTALYVAGVTQPGRYPDGEGLYLQVKGVEGKSWLYCFKVGGKRREMGLGSFPTVSLAEAREKARECRRQRADGIDPIDARREAREAKRAEKQLAAAKVKTFKECAEEDFETQKAKWRQKTVTKRLGLFENYIFPMLANVPVCEDSIISKRALKSGRKRKRNTANGEYGEHYSTVTGFTNANEDLRLAS